MMTNTDRAARMFSRRHICSAAITSLLVGHASAKKKKKRGASSASGKIGGTVFQASGRLLPGATVTATPVQGKGKYQAVADRRGEYLVRVPAGDATYNVVAEARGFTELTKQVSVYGEDKANANFVLDPKPEK